ncbi:MAG TPA: terminase TerL endonuclease subunit [Burkholderiales bacterium]
MAIAAGKRRRAAVPPPSPPPGDRPPRPIGKYERLCWERQARDVALAYPDGPPADPRQTAHPRGLWFNHAEGQRTVRFIEGMCRHSKGEWAGRLIHLEPIQRDTLTTIFGWMRADGTRRFRIAWIEWPRKNTKSTTAAGVGLYLLVGDGEPGAEVYSTATKKDQAKIVHDAATAMVKASPELKRFLRPLRNNISCARLGSKFEPLGADSERLDGLNAHGHIPDEVHAHKDRGIWDVVETSKGARRQPLTFAITTAGVYDPEAIGWEMHDYACKVLEGAIEDDAFFALICAADEGDDWQQPATWYKANPLLGVSIKESYIAEQCEAAKTRPSFLNTFLRLHLNIWTQQLTRWIAMEAWNACTAAPAPFGAERDCYGGLDLSTKLDATAFALVAPADDGWFDCLFRFWVPEALAEQRERKRLAPSYADWIRRGFLRATPGNVIDYDFVERDILELARTVRLREIGYDPWNATQTAVRLQRALNPSNVKTGFQMVEMRQGMQTLSEPAKEFEKLVVAGKLRHGGDPVMRWMVANVTTRSDANGNIAPDKSNSTGKIDGVLAVIMALGRAIVRKKTASKYETDGLVAVG